MRRRCSGSRESLSPSNQSSCCRRFRISGLRPLRWNQHLYGQTAVSIRELETVPVAVHILESRPRIRQPHAAVEPLARIDTETHAVVPHFDPDTLILTPCRDLDEPAPAPW